MTANTTYPTGAIAVASLSGDETVLIGPGATGSNKSPQIMSATTRQIADLASLVSNNLVITNLNTVGAGTVTAAGIVGGIVARGGAQGAAAFIDTTATAALIIAALPAGAPVGSSFEWEYQNTTDAQATLAGGVGVTLSGNLIVPKVTAAKYLVTVTAADTVSIAFLYGAQLSPLPFSSYATQAVTTATTASLSGLTSALISTLALSGMATAGGTIVLPTAADLVGAIPNCRAGMSLQVNIINNGTATIQLTGLAGTIISGTSKVQVAKLQSYNVNIDSLGSTTFTGLAQTAIA